MLYEYIRVLEDKGEAVEYHFRDGNIKGIPAQMEAYGIKFKGYCRTVIIDDGYGDVRAGIEFLCNPAPYTGTFILDEHGRKMLPSDNGRYYLRMSEPVLEVEGYDIREWSLETDEQYKARLAMWYACQFKAGQKAYHTLRKCLVDVVEVRAPIQHIDDPFPVKVTHNFAMMESFTYEGAMYYPKIQEIEPYPWLLAMYVTEDEYGIGEAIGQITKIHKDGRITVEGKTTETSSMVFSRSGWCSLRKMQIYPKRYKTITITPRRTYGSNDEDLGKDDNKNIS